MKKSILFALIGVLAVISIITPNKGLAQTQTSSNDIAELRAILENLQKQVASLQLKLEAQTKIAPIQNQTTVSTPSYKGGSGGGSASATPTETTYSKFISLQELPGNPKVSCTVPTLNPGSKNNSVYLIQMLLSKTGDYPERLITGYYGKFTTQAVKNFQSRKGLVSNSGTIDSSTAKVLTEETVNQYSEECVGEAGGGGTPVPTPIPNPSIRVLSPSKGDMWQVGNIYTIKWASNGVPTDSVNIYLGYVRPACLDTEPRCLIAEVMPETIVTKTFNDGAFEWTIPTKDTLVGTRQITIESTFGNVIGRSDPFTITNTQTEKYIYVTRPAENETLYKGEKYEIRWSAPKDTKYVDILYDNGVRCVTSPCPSFAVAASRVLNTGSYVWTVPQSLEILHPSYRIEIVDSENQNLRGLSGKFTIQERNDTNQPPVITGVSGPTQLKVNETGTWIIKAYDPEKGYLSYDVYWGDLTSGVAGGVSQMYDKTLQQSASLTHQYRSASTYTIIFTVTDDKGAGAKGTITVNVTSETTSSPYISEIIVPNVAYKNSSNPSVPQLPILIQWASRNVSGVMIDLREKNTSNVRKLYEYTVNQIEPWTPGLYAWLVPSDVKDGDLYFIRVTDKVSGVYSESKTFKVTTESPQS